MSHFVDDTETMGSSKDAFVAGLGRVGFLLFLAAAAAAPIFTFVLAYDALDLSEVVLATVRDNSNVGACAAWDEGTQTFTLQRGKVVFDTEARDYVQLTSGYTSPCMQCPEVPANVFGSPTVSECGGINDNLGNAGIAERRARQIQCGERGSVDALTTDLTVSNHVEVDAVALGMSVSAGGVETARCSSTDFLYAAGTDHTHTSQFLDIRNKARNVYFAKGNTGRPVFCMCQPCGLTSGTSLNAAGGTTQCTRYAAFAGATSEMCMHSPVTKWAPDVLS